MSAFKMLLKAGYSLDEAISKVGRRPDEKEKREILEYLSGAGESVAEINEAKYSSVGATAEDRIMDRFDYFHKNTYETIRSRHICGIGDCNSNLTILRRIKYGNGSLSKRGFLNKGFTKGEAAYYCEANNGNN